MISIIIPTYNEEGTIGKTVSYLNTIIGSKGEAEVIVVDGGSDDNTIKDAQRSGAFVYESSQKGRSAQMNEGARNSNGDVIYFLHADSIPPSTFIEDINEAVVKGFTMGCYRLRFDYDHWFLKANAWFTRFDIDAFRYGDQSLFVTREAFNKAGGFCEKHIVMEDNEIIKRLRKNGQFLIFPKPVITSARKYVVNGVVKMQSIFYLIYFLYQFGYSQDRLVSIYKNLVRQDKL